MSSITTRRAKAAVLASASILTLASALLAAPSPAQAANECGAPVSGVVTCSDASYTDNIDYSNLTTSLTLNLNNPAMTVAKEVILNGSGDMSLHVISVDTVNGQSGGIVTSNNGSGASSVTIDSGNIFSPVGQSVQVESNSGASSFTLNGGHLSAPAGVTLHASAGGQALAVINGGRIDQTNGGDFGVLAQIESGAPPSLASVVMSGGIVDSATTSTALEARHNAAGGSALVQLSGGSLQGASGIVSTTASGVSQVVITGGSISASSMGALASVTTGGSGSASVSMTAGTVTATTTGLEASNIGAGQALVTLNGGQVSATTALLALNTGQGAANVVIGGGSATSTGTSAPTVQAKITNTASTATASIVMTDGSVTSPTNNPALQSLNQGLGNASIRMDGGSVTGIEGLEADSNAISTVTVNGGTITGSSQGIRASSDGASGKALITLNGGQVSASAALLALNDGQGDAGVVITGGVVQFSGASDRAVQAKVTNTASTATTSILMSSGVVTGATDNFALQSSNQGHGDAVITIGGGTITGGVGADALATFGSAKATVSGGTITATGTGVEASSAAGSATVTMTGGAVTVSGGSAAGLDAGLSSGNHDNATTIAISGGVVSVTGALSVGAYSINSGTGLSSVQMSGGTITASGLNADGVFARDTAGSGYAVQITGGAITGGSANGSALHLASPAGGTVTIGANATLDGSVSGVAIRDGDLDHDGVDETGGAAAITTAGTLKGAIVLGSGADTVEVTGGSIAGNIQGSAAASVDFAPASGLFVYGASYGISGVGTVSASSGSTEIDGTITANALTVRGGSLALDGTATVNQATVSGGLLSVNGTLSSAVTVQSGGKLGGNGTTGSVAVQSGGTVAPGNSIGTLHVSGAFSQAAGSTYQAELAAGSSTADRIAVTGAATLAPGALLAPVIATGGVYVPGTRYTVLTATGGLTGTYTFSSTPFTAFLGLKDSYDANDVYVDVTQVRAFSAAARTPNQLAVANAVPLTGQVGLALLNLPTDAAAQGAFDQLSPVDFTAVRSTLASDSSLVRGAALDRLRGCETQPGAAVACPDGDHAAGWAQAFGGWNRIDATSAVTGARSASGGFLIGADAPLPTAGARLGVFAGYSHTTVNADPGSASIDNDHIGAYGGLQRGPIALRADAGLSYDAVTSTRSIAFAGFSDRPTARYNAYTAQVEGEAGYRLQAAPGLTVEPFLGVAYVSVHTQGFTEQGGAAALAVKPGDTNVTYATLGVRPSVAFDLHGADAVLSGIAGWRYATGDLTSASTQAFTGGPDFTIRGAPLAQGSGVVGAELGVRLHKQVSVSVSYGGAFGGGNAGQTAQATVAIRF